ncbi:MAG: energy-coupling factor ABC transporter substrate-binding protein [Candidatus Methanomethylophilaceae archaeon]|nr:energy-coupling factor ABC transporter substrate-binding protein [Candidatus Methanomethylophilaceae archaeon]
MDKKNYKFVYIAGFAVIALMVVGTLAYGAGNDSEFSGSDDQGGGIISDLDPGYQPWWDGIFGDYELPSEVESFLFALQAAIGAIIIGFFIGMVHSDNKRKKLENLNSTTE